MPDLPVAAATVGHVSRVPASVRHPPPSGGRASRAPGDPAELLRAVEAAGEATAAPGADLAREREGTAACLRAEAPDPGRAGAAEDLPDGPRLHYCGARGRLGTWGSGAAPQRGRAGRWFCVEHRETRFG